MEKSTKDTKKIKPNQRRFILIVQFPKTRNITNKEEVVVKDK